MEDSRRLGRLIICELPSKLNLPHFSPINPGSTLFNIFLVMLVMMGATENMANKYCPLLSFLAATEVRRIALQQAVLFHMYHVID